VVLIFVISSLKASAITPKPKIRKNKPKLQVMSEEILEAIKNKKTAFYNWKTNGQ
jgi:hypothetical protein